MKTSWKKSQKNVISGKLKGFEQSYLEAKFATPESTLTKPHYIDGNFKFWIFFNPSSLKNLENPKTSYFKKYKYLSNHFQWQDLQPPESTLTDSNNRIEIFNVLEFSHLSFFWKFRKKNVVFRKLRKFEQSYLEAKLATSESILTESHNKDANIKFCETFYI